MSVVIVGGNERMEREYKDICKCYKCKAKVFTKMPSNFKNKIGSPDLVVLFTNTVSHKMVITATNEASKSNSVISRSHSSSSNALKCILQKYCNKKHNKDKA